MEVNTFTVVIRNEGGNWWAESPEASGWSAAASTREELEELVPEGLRFWLSRPGAWIAVTYVDANLGIVVASLESAASAPTPRQVDSDSFGGGVEGNGISMPDSKANAELELGVAV